MALTHSHFCKYCDTTWSCVGEEPYGCLLEGYEIRNHGCEEREAYRKKMANLLRAASGKCKYGCSRPCSHPKGGKKEAA